MSEKQPRSHEIHKAHHESEHGSLEHHERLKNKLEQEANEARKSNTSETITDAQKRIEKLAQTSDQLTQSYNTDFQKESSHYKNVKVEQSISFTRTMTRVRKRLNPIERPLSKLVHNPIIDKASEVTGKTIARPSGLLGGAFFAFVGTSALLWITRYYGYEYNYLAVILLFAIGMVSGLVIELVYRNIKKRP